MTNRKHQTGAALLIIMAMVLAGIAILVTTSLSINSLREKANHKTTNALQEARKALLGFALQSTPPGVLPCPDSDGDGVGDVSGGNCTTALGRLPYRDILLPELRDGSNSHLWYSLNLNLRSMSSVSKNSSTSTSLNLDGTELAAILIAPNRPLASQNRNNNSPLSDYLEGINADANTNNYSRVVDDLHNDVILAIENQDFWNLIETRVLNSIAELLSQYQNACGVYPWAASAGMPPYDSVDTLQQGNVPFDSALPTDWNNACALGIAPESWMRNAWADLVYFAFCTASEGNCLNISGDKSLNSAAILLAPGTRLSGQTRVSYALSDYYENNNAVADSNFFFRLNKNLDGSFNDVLLSLSP